MDAKKRVRATINCDNPDRLVFSVPGPRWVDPNDERPVVAQLRSLLARCPGDMAACFAYPPPLGWEPPEDLPVWGLDGNFSDGIDEWGAKWKGVYLTHHPLEDWAGADSYRFPDPLAPGRLRVAEDLVSRHGRRYLLWFFGYSLFERLWILRGFENLLTDPYIHEKEFLKLRDRVTEFNLELIESFLVLPFDGVMVGDDLGSQTSLFMDPEMWRKYYKVGYEKMFDLIHSKGRDVWMHADGNIMSILPDLIEIGLDVTNPVQPSAMDVDVLSARFKGRVAFFGGIDVQQTFQHGTPDEVSREIEDLLGKLGGPEGGFIPSPTNAILPDIPLENFVAALQVLLEHAGISAEDDESNG